MMFGNISIPLVMGLFMLLFLVPVYVILMIAIGLAYGASGAVHDEARTLADRFGIHPHFGHWHLFRRHAHGNVRH